MEGPDLLAQEQNTWPNQPEPATDMYAELLPETMQGFKIDQKQVTVRQAAFTTHLQPDTDQYYDPVDKDLIKISRWKHLTRIIAVCLRWKNKKRGQINPVAVWEAEKAIVAQSQEQLYRATLSEGRGWRQHQPHSTTATTWSTTSRATPCLRAAGGDW
jgi:hypothetical protein